MKNFLPNIKRIIIGLRNNIAFIPGVISFLGISFALVMVYAEEQGISKYLLEYVPQLVINDVDTSKTVLSTAISGIISIMVFSFSMVMILLNQASSNFSPRLLPGLISNRRHQIILGIYMATILYCIFVLVSIQPAEENYYPPGFAVLIAIIMMTISLGSFIYFIHSISQEIQVSNIMETIYNDAASRLQYLIEKEPSEAFSLGDTSNWHAFNSLESGYVRHIDYDEIAEIAKEKQTKIIVLPYKGLFVMSSMPIFRSENQLDKESLDRISNYFTFSKDEMVEDNYAFAFKQINEIALKAMSPGINDPGTAKSAIDYLTQLFSLRLKKKDDSYYVIDNEAFVEISTVNFSTLLYDTMAALRTYCKHDVLLMRQLFNMLTFLNQEAKQLDNDYKKSIAREIEHLEHDAKESIKYDFDFKQVLSK